MTCDKTVYHTHKEAQQAAAHVGQKQRRGMKTYKCPECNGYHIATMRPRTNMGRKPDKYKEDYTLYRFEEIRIPNPHKINDKPKKIETTYKPFAYLRNK